MKLNTIILLVAIIGIIIPVQVSAVSNVEFWNELDETVDNLNPLDTYTVVFTRDTSFVMVDILFSFEGNTRSLWWNESGYFFDGFIIDVNSSQVNPIYVAQKIVFTVDEHAPAGTWNVVISLDNDSTSLNIVINKLTSYQVFNEKNDWGEYDFGGVWASNAIIISVISNADWTLIISSTDWTNGTYVLENYTINETETLTYEGHGDKNLTVVFELYLEGIATGLFEQTTSIEIGFDVYDIDQRVRIGDIVVIDPYFNQTGDVKVTGYMTHDIDALGGHEVIFEIADDSNFYLIDHLEVLITDDNGYFLTYLIANFSQWMRATIEVDGEVYYSSAIMVQGIELEYDLSIHVEKSIQDLGNEFIEDYGIPTAIGFVSVLGIMFAVGRRFFGSPL